MIIVGEHLRTLRKTAGLTQGELALQVDVPLPRLIKLEKDGGPVTPFERMRLANALGLAPATLTKAAQGAGLPAGLPTVGAGRCPCCGQVVPQRRPDCDVSDEF